MSAKDLMIKPNSITNLLHPRVLTAGDAVNFAGRVAADRNIMLQEFFRAVVSSEPNEEEEGNIVIVYLSRSTSTAAKLAEYARHEVEPAVRVIVKEVFTFDHEEILDLLADLEDGEQEVRYLIIEDIDSYPDKDTCYKVRKLREAAVGNFLLMTSSGLIFAAHHIARIENDSETFLGLIRDKGYDRNRKLSNEMDIHLYVEPVGYDPVDNSIAIDAVISKSRGRHEFIKTVFRTIHRQGNF